MVAGHQVVDGIDAIKITGLPGQLTLLVNPATYLRVQLTVGPLQCTSSGCPLPWPTWPR